MTLVDDKVETTEPAPPRQRERRGGAWFATLCALVALAAAAIGLFWDFAPQFRPDPLEVVGADVTIAAIEPEVTLETWLQKTRPDDFEAVERQLFGRVPSESERGLMGHLVYVKIQVDGHKHKDVSLAYRTYDAATQKPFEPVGLDESVVNRLQRARVDAPSERSVELLWVPSLKNQGDSFIRVELTSERGLLAIDDSATLREGLIRPAGAGR